MAVMLAPERFEIGEELGVGALGRVVRVLDQRTGVRYAGKILHPSADADEKARERFTQEARLAHQLNHPNIVRVHGLVQQGGHSMLLMELVEGTSLATLLATEGPLPERRILHLAEGIAAGLAAAHSAGVIHRDLKPANILLAPGDVPKIADFGLARATSLAGAASDAFKMVGTPHYLPPESIDPCAVDPRSDLYSLGCILFEMASGHPPFAGASALAILEAHAREPAPPLPDTLSPDLRKLIASLLSKSPSDRPQSAEAVQVAAAAIARGGIIKVQQPEIVRCCAHCSEPLVDGVPICFACGSALPWARVGPYTIIVTGPGSTGHKLDQGVRRKLLEWIRTVPTLDASRLERRLPRLPFVLVSRIDEESAHQIRDTLERLGLSAEIQLGALDSPKMGKKARRLALRTGAVAAFTATGCWQFANFWNPAKVLWALWALLGGALAIPFLGGLAVGWRAALRPAARRRPSDSAGMPPLLTTRITALVELVPRLETPRHRRSLRAVAERLFALFAALPVSARDHIIDESGRILDLAMLAAVRLDELEGRLGRADFQNPTAELRALLHERDQWAARLLHTLGLLDALRSRVLCARVKREAETLEEVLNDLRAEVAGLEEVQAL